jgi:hypothetical protein
MNSSPFSINYYFNIIRKLADKYWFVPLVLIVLVKVVLLINNIKSFITFVIIFYSIYIIFSCKYRQVLAGINWLFHIISNINPNFVYTNKNNIHNESDINDFNIEEKENKANKTIIVKKKFYVNVEKKIVIRQQHNYYLVMEKNEESNGLIEASDPTAID